jgi:ABC-type dipeptide/oligopeptide/nickel transport system ATPase component
MKYGIQNEIEKLVDFRKDKIVLDDIITNYELLISSITGIDSLAKLDEFRDRIAPAVRILGKWKNNDNLYSYMEHRLKYAQELKSALDEKVTELSLEARRQQPAAIFTKTSAIPKNAPAQKYVVSETYMKEQPRKTNWSYQPTMLDLLNYYEAKGVVGETNLCILQTLGAINKLSFGIESLSGSGKSHVIDTLLDLLPENEVYTMELSSKTAQIYSADEINRHQIIYIPELQKAMNSNNPLVVELLKGLTEGKDVSRKVRNQGQGSIEEYVIKGNKGIIFTLAIENAFKYDAEFSRRVFILSTDASAEQTDLILKHKTQKRHALDYEGGANFQQLASHIEECLNFPSVNYENPFADYVSEQIPRTIRARSYDDYLFNLINASAKFNFKNRMLKDNVLYLHLEDVYLVTELYWKQFSRGLYRIPVFGEDVMGLFSTQEEFSAKDAYHSLKENNPTYTFNLVEQTLESLVDAGFLIKDDYRSTKPSYSKINEMRGFNPEFDWNECWHVGLEFMTANYPGLVDDWLIRQKDKGSISAYNPLLRQQITLIEDWSR